MSDLPNTPAGLMQLMPSTSSQINSFSKGIVDAVRTGQENPLNVLLQIRAMEKSLKIIYENIKYLAITEADKYPGDTFDFKGNIITKGDNKTEYDYLASNDPIYERLLYEFEKAEKELDARRTFLKTLPEPTTIVDQLTGEVVTIKPALKKSTPGLKISIK